MAYNKFFLSIWHDLIFPHFSQGNSILMIIAGCSLIAMTVFFERMFFLKKSEMDTTHFILSLRNLVKNENIVEAVALCDETGGAIAQIVRAGLLKHERSKEEIESSMEIAGLSEIAKLEKNAKILSVISHVTPLIGLLGTVLGFIQAFSEMRKSGLMDISTTAVGAAMEYALITTAAGLVVAIPTIVAYNYLISKIKTLVLEMQTTAWEVVDLLVHRKDPYEI